MQTGPPPAPGEDGSVALAFVNTRHREGRRIVDRIATAESLADWLASRGLAVPGRRATVAELGRVHALRDAVRALMHTTATGQQPAMDALRSVNEAARAAPPIPTLEWAPPRGLVRGHAMGGANALDSAVSEIAADAIALLTDQRRDALIECSGPSCVRFLLKDHSRRHWCSAACGERARAARYYQRSRRDAGA